MSVRGSPQYLANGAKRSGVEFAKRFRREIAARTRTLGLKRRVTLTKQTVSYHGYLHYVVPRNDPIGWDRAVKVGLNIQELARLVARVPGFQWPNTFVCYASIRVRYLGTMIHAAGLPKSSYGFGPKSDPSKTTDTKKTYYNARMHVTRDLTNFALGLMNWLSYHSSRDGTRLLSFRIRFLSTHPKPKPKPKRKRSGKGSPKAPSKAGR